MDKHYRGSNFREVEKELLLKIVAAHFNTIENKKIDGMTMKMKRDAWDRVCDDFNARSNNEPRTTAQLKNLYNNFKRKLKSECANDNVELYKSGSDLNSHLKLSDGKARLIDLLKPQLISIKNIRNIYDSTANYAIEDVETTGMTVTDSSSEAQEYFEQKPDLIQVINLDSNMEAAESDATGASASTSTSALSPTVGHQTSSTATATITSTSATTTSYPKKRKTDDDYSKVEEYCAAKLRSNEDSSRKIESEIDVLLMKLDVAELQKKQEEQKLMQEQLKRMQEEEKLKQEEVKTKILLLELKQRRDEAL